MSGGEFRSLLEAGDVTALRSAWARAAAHLPQPETYELAEITMHMARTSNEHVTLKARAWSHRWLTERSLPSQLPDALKPRAERLYPIIVSAVGISVNARSEFMKPIVGEIRTAMENAVLDAEAEGKLEDSPFVRLRMSEARERTIKSLVGRLDHAR